MAELLSLLPDIVAGVLSGGSTAIAGGLAVLRDTRHKVQELEQKITKLASEESVAAIRRQIQGWEDEPPTWAKRLMGRTRKNTLTDLDSIQDVEERWDRLSRDLKSQLRRLEDRIEDAESSGGRISTLEAREMLTKEEYLRDQAERMAEIGRFRESLGQLNGMMRGILATMNAEGPRKR